MLQAFEAARDAFDSRLRDVRAGHWDLETPCPEWDVRALVNHVIGGDLRYAMLLHGAGLEEMVTIRWLPSGAVRRRCDQRSKSRVPCLEGSNIPRASAAAATFGYAHHRDHRKEAA